MNRLWVRISLTFIGILFFLILLPMIFTLTLQATDLQIHEEFRAKALNLLVEGPRKVLLTRTLRFLLVFSLVGTLVGVITSRSLTAPLARLAEAARAIGSQEWNRRIDVKGTEEVRQVAHAFNEMAADLEKAEKLRSNMLADIAHELRTPISVIQGNLRAILDDVYEMDKSELVHLYEQTRQLSRLVDDLHELALAEANLLRLDRTTINLKQLVEDVASLYAPLLEDEQLSLDIKTRGAAPSIEGDRARLTQCLSNLINNAIRYTPKGGTIAIELSREEGHAYLSVSDTGIGISPEHLPRIFDRFYRVDPARNRDTGGSGLGLAITKAIIEAHGGEISADSAGENRGSEFSIKLPLT